MSSNNNQTNENNDQEEEEYDNDDAAYNRFIRNLLNSARNEIQRFNQNDSQQFLHFVTMYENIINQGALHGELIDFLNYACGQKHFPMFLLHSIYKLLIQVYHLNIPELTPIEMRSKCLSLLAFSRYYNQVFRPIRHFNYIPTNLNQNNQNQTNLNQNNSNNPYVNGDQICDFVRNQYTLHHRLSSADIDYISNDILSHSNDTFSIAMFRCHQKFFIVRYIKSNSPHNIPCSCDSYCFNL